MHLSVVIVTYQSRDQVRTCLRSLLDRTDGIQLEVLLVDNASADGTPAIVSREFPEVQLLAQEENLGFARACNLAARRARGRFLLFLNPDTEILDGAVARLLAFAQAHPEAGIYGGKTLYADGSLNPTCCFDQPTLWSVFCMGTGLASLFRGSALFNSENLGGWARDTPRAVGVVTGCFLLISREHWSALGGFDESFFLYSEDTDLALRSRALGRACLFSPDAVIVHHGGGSDRIRSEKRVRVFRARAQFFRKHWSRLPARFAVAMLDLHAFTRMLAHRVLSARSGERDGYQEWRRVWSSRDQWRDGGVRPP